jgi:hypothetical protein
LTVVEECGFVKSIGGGSRTFETLSAEEFEGIVERFIERASAWDGALPVETFFAAWEELAEDAPPLEVQATFVDNELVLETAPESPLTARGNRIRLEDGRELVIRFRSFAFAA